MTNIMIKNDKYMMLYKVYCIHFYYLVLSKIIQN
jgi:hypothetical protein